VEDDRDLCFVFFFFYRQLMNDDDGPRAIFTTIFVCRAQFFVFLFVRANSFETPPPNVIDHRMRVSNFAYGESTW